MGEQYQPYRTCADRHDFEAMIVPSRYAQRSSEFELSIASTAEHFWNPEDPDYIDYEMPFDHTEHAVFREDGLGEMNSAVRDKLDEGQALGLAQDVSRWLVSSLLHGEQGALALSTSLVDLFVDPGAQEYMTNQAREEARHVHAFSRYMAVRFDGQVDAASPLISSVLTQVIASDKVYEKIIGMQLILEGMAMGAFVGFHKDANDPLLRRLAKLTMTDEAFHHAFGKQWATAQIPLMDEETRDAAEDWAFVTFNAIITNLFDPGQRAHLYPKYGLDADWVRSAILESFSDDRRTELRKESTNLWRIVIKTLRKRGVITDRTRDQYNIFLNMDELDTEKDVLAGQAVVDEGLAELRAINAEKRHWFLTPEQYREKLAARDR